MCLYEPSATVYLFVCVCVRACVRVCVCVLYCECIQMSTIVCMFTPMKDWHKTSFSHNRHILELVSLTTFELYNKLLDAPTLVLWDTVIHQMQDILTRIIWYIDCCIVVQAN